MLILINGRHL